MRDGRVKLEDNELRVGDFFVKREREHIKITDLNGVFSFRSHAKSAVGRWLDGMWERARKDDKSASRTLHTYIATMWSFHSVAPDDEYVKDALVATQNALDRHPEWYGVKKAKDDGAGGQG